MGVIMKKKCPKCGKTKPASAFYKRGDYLMSYCKLCQRAHSNTVKRDLRARLKALVQEAKSKPCSDCGEQHPFWAMDFDHRDRSTKSFNISAASSKCPSEARLLEELAKCDLVCALCHRYRTHGMRREPSPSSHQSV